MWSWLLHTVLATSTHEYQKETRNVAGKSAENYCKTLRPDFTSKLVHRLAYGTPKFYIISYDTINRKLVNLSCDCSVKLGLIFGGYLILAILAVKGKDTKI